MKKELTAYTEKIKVLLESGDEKTDWQSEREDLLIHIKFFQQERLVHLIVTMTFALLSLISIVGGFVYAPLFALTVLFLALTIPYIAHYYFLENSVQRLYEFYDEMGKK